MSRGASTRPLMVAGGADTVDGRAGAKLCPVMRRTAAALFITHLAHRPGASAALDPSRVHDPRLRLTAIGMR